MILHVISLVHIPWALKEKESHLHETCRFQRNSYHQLMDRLVLTNVERVSSDWSSHYCFFFHLIQTFLFYLPVISRWFRNRFIQLIIQKNVCWTCSLTSSSELVIQTLALMNCHIFTFTFILSTVTPGSNKNIQDCSSPCRFPMELLWKAAGATAGRW